MSSSTIVTPHVFTGDLRGDYNSNMGKADKDKTKGVDKCYTYLSSCGADSQCKRNDWQYQQPSGCGLSGDLKQKRKRHCARVCDNTCPQIGGFVPALDDRTFTQKLVTPSFAFANCPYKLGNIKTEVDMTKWKTTFKNSDATNKELFDTKVIPFYCSQGDNLDSGGPLGACQTYCSGQWNSNPHCKGAAQIFCSKGDNAINTDVCYQMCNNPGTDGRPSWCDAQISSVCKLVDTQPQAPQPLVSDESFAGAEGISIALIFVALFAFIYVMRRAR